jgi:REP element-mobilizing transposase RayT
MQLSENERPFVRKPISHTSSFAGRFGATYFITICCHKRHSNQLCEENVAHAILERAKRYEAQRMWHLRLLLLMPDQLHALLSIGGDVSLSRVIANFKRATTKFAVRLAAEFFRSSVAT